MSVASVSEQGRATQGVKLIRVDEGDSIAAITKLDEQEEEVIVPEADAAESTDASNAADNTDNNEQAGEQTEPPVAE